MIRAIISDMGRVILWFDNDVFIRKLAAPVYVPFATQIFVPLPAAVSAVTRLL